MEDADSQPMTQVQWMAYATSVSGHHFTEASARSEWKRFYDNPDVYPRHNKPGMNGAVRVWCPLVERRKMRRYRLEEHEIEQASNTLKNPKLTTSSKLATICRIVWGSLRSLGMSGNLSEGTKALPQIRTLSMVWDSPLQAPRGMVPPSRWQNW